jgi:hypothetical protein
MRRILGMLIVTVACAGSVPAFAQVAGPNCAEPPKPAALDTQDKINKWARRAETYQRCLMNFSAAQKEVADQHTKAANAAVASWNSFVKKMNAASRE